MFLSEELQKKWQPVLEHSDLPEIKDSHRRAVTATLLENQEKAARENGTGGYSTPSLLGEAAPVNATGAGIDNYDPVLISLVRRSMPNLIAYDICGVQPMTGPTGLIFAMRPRYDNQGGDEAFYDVIRQRANAGSDGTGNTDIKAQKLDPSTGLPVNGEADTAAQQDPTAANYDVGVGMSTANAEALGDSASNAFNEMAFSVEKVAVTARSRALKAEYTMELAQDLKAIHGLDAETELANILSSEILAEINREVVRTVNVIAKSGAQNDTQTAGVFDLDVDSNGRWSVEKFKGLVFQLEREANAIAKQTRRGKGNLLICGSDVASALQMAGVLDYTPALSTNLNVDDTGNTFAGVLNGRIRVYIDPYFNSSTGNQYATMGYKGSSAFDAGMFYCPYVPLQMVRAVGENTFQPKIGFKTRYGMVANPFSNASANDAGLLKANDNVYYRSIVIRNLM